jgi:hypothetical protein
MAKSNKQLNKRKPRSSGQSTPKASSSGSNPTRSSKYPGMYYSMLLKPCSYILKARKATNTSSNATNRFGHAFQSGGVLLPDELIEGSNSLEHHRSESISSVNGGVALHEQLNLSTFGVPNAVDDSGDELKTKLLPNHSSAFSSSKPPIQENAGFNDDGSDDEVLLPGKGADFKSNSRSRASPALDSENSDEDEIIRDYIENIRNAGGDLDSFPSAFTSINLESPEMQPRPKRTGKDSKNISQEISKLATSLGRLTSDDQAFDVTDFEKYSRPTRRRRKGDLPVLATISDDELRENFKSTWARDREKKKLRRELREESRQQGLLGKKVDAEFDLRSKYPTVMRLFEVKEELIDFFDRDDQTYVLSLYQTVDCIILTFLIG